MVNYSIFSHTEVRIIGKLGNAILICLMYTYMYILYNIYIYVYIMSVHINY